MFYKNSKWIIKKEDLEDGKIITNSIIIRKHKKKIIAGVVKNNNGEVLKDCAVVLQKVNKDSDTISDFKMVITNEDGKFIFAIYIDEESHYKIKVYGHNRI